MSSGSSGRGRVKGTARLVPSGSGSREWWWMVVVVMIVCVIVVRSREQRGRRVMSRSSDRYQTVLRMTMCGCRQSRHIRCGGSGVVRGRAGHSICKGERLLVVLWWWWGRRGKGWRVMGERMSIRSNQWFALSRNRSRSRSRGRGRGRSRGRGRGRGRGRAWCRAAH